MFNPLKIKFLINDRKLSDKNFSMKEFCKSIKLTDAALRAIIERGAIPKVNTLESIALYFGVDMNYFFSGMNSDTIKHEEVKVTEVNTEFLLDRIEKQAIRINKLEEELKIYKSNETRYTLQNVSDLRVAETPIELKKK